MIVIVNLNPAIDRYLSFSQVRPGEVHRSRPVRLQPGGKGINVARMLKNWGFPVTVNGFLGGHTGRLLNDLLAAEAISFRAVRTGVETRCCMIGFDEASGAETVWNEPGGTVPEAAWNRFLQTFPKLLAGAQAVVFSGSAPPGRPTGFWLELATLASARRCPLFLDIPPADSLPVLAKSPFLIKPNHFEAAKMVDFSQNSMGEPEPAATGLVARGAEQVLVTQGALPAVFASRETVQTIPIPRLPDNSRIFATGAGDATMAGCVAAFLKGKSGMEMARMGIAAGTAYASLGTACRWEDVEKTGFREEK